MAANDNYCLRLNEFEGNAKIYWQELQKENDFCDVTLACENKQIKTHKLIISSFSPVLANILKSNQTPHPVIYFRKVKYRDLQNLLNFIYQGEANVAQEDLNNFLEIADELDVRGLCKRNLDSYKSIENSISQVFHKNTCPSEERKKTWDESLENDNDNDTISQAGFNNETVGQTYFNNETVDKKDFTNDNVTNTLITPKNKTSNQVSAGNKKQNIISTVAIQDAGGSYQCVQCDYKSKHKQNLNRHTQSIHEGERQPCPQCDFKGKESSQVRQHVKSVHEGVRYPCDLCDYKATTNSHLRRHHLRRHM